MVHPLAKIDETNQPITYLGEFWKGKAHGWGDAQDGDGAKLRILCHEGVIVKVIMTFDKDVINVFSIIGGNTKCGQATNHFPNNVMTNFMYSKDGFDIGKSKKVKEQNAFYNKDGSVGTALKPDWWTYAKRD